MLLLFTFILMILEVLIIFGLFKLLFIINDLNSKIPDYQEQVLDNIKMVREELKILNSRLQEKPVEPFSNAELGQVFGKTLVQLVLFRRISVPKFLMLLFKHKKRLKATIEAKNYA